MNGSMRTRMRFLLGLACCVASGGSARAQQILTEDFNAATGTGGGLITATGEYTEVDNWDDGLVGEWAFAGAPEGASLSSAYAMGSRFAGVGNSGAGQLIVTGGTGDWTAGLFWPDLVLPAVGPENLVIRADVKGYRVGGAYQIRLEGLRYVPFGLDEDFSTVTGTGGGTILAPGGYEGYTSNWDDGIEGEGAFAGVYGAASVFGGVTVFGQVGSQSGLLAVRDISFGPGSGWYAGFVWEDQVLPSTNLDEVVLRARLTGFANPTLGQTLGDYAIRLEDTDFDWLLFRGSATGYGQVLGGPLSTAEEGGFGDQVFDVNHGPFNVVVLFDNDGPNKWGTGGTLVVDDLFLSGGQTAEVMGSVSLAETTSTSFKSAGGLLASGVSTFGNIDESFDGDGTGEGGGRFFDAASGANGYTPGWDTGLDGEAAFAGYWGTQVAVNGGADAYVDLTAGVDGGAAGVLTVEDVEVTQPGGWWAGLMWQNQQMPDLPLSEIYLTAKVKGIPGASGMYGQYHLRIEDADADFLAFTGTADPSGQFQEIGGPLSDAVEGTFIGDGTFNLDHGPFTVVVAFFDEANTWGTGGTLIVDDLFFTSAAFGTGADAFSAVVTFDDVETTWAGGGTLTVDNLRVSVVSSDLDDDGVTDLSDMAGFLQCFSGEGVLASEPCLLLDFDGDNDVDLYDWPIVAERAQAPAGP